MSFFNQTEAPNSSKCKHINEYSDSDNQSIRMAENVENRKNRIQNFCFLANQLQKQQVVYLEKPTLSIQGNQTNNARQTRGIDSQVRKIEKSQKISSTNPSNSSENRMGKLYYTAGQ